MYTPLRVQSSPNKYSPRLIGFKGSHGFRGFGAILPQGQLLSPGQSYTFTFTFPWYSQYPSDSDAIQFLGKSLSEEYGIATVVNASRALFSSNYAVTIIPTQSMTVADFIMAFTDAWKSAPWYVAAPDFVQAESGTASSQAGGIQELVPDIVGSVSSTVGQGISAAMKPLLPYLLIGGGIYLLIVLGPSLAKRRMLS